MALLKASRLEMLRIDGLREGIRGEVVAKHLEAEIPPAKRIIERGEQ